MYRLHFETNDSRVFEVLERKGQGISNNIFPAKQCESFFVISTMSCDCGFDGTLGNHKDRFIKKVRPNIM